MQQIASTTEYDASKGKTIFCFCKRTFDIVFSACVTAVLVIPVGAVCIAIASETPGSPVYSQERIGRNGKTIRVLKLRSMVADAGNVERYLDPDQLRQWQVERKVDNDPRITRVGRIIRKTSLDELPQFLNVLKGDIPLRILKTRPEFSEKSMGAFALPAKSSTNEEKAFSQVVSCFASDLRMRRISEFDCNCIGGMETQFLAKPVFGVSPVHSGALFQKSINGLAKAAW